MYPQVGSRAPSFTAPDGNGKAVTFPRSYGGSIVVLYFYPKDNTSGCTKEACGFRDGYDGFTKLGIRVVGVSPDGSASHSKFASKLGLPFTLVADEDKQICQSYGTWQEKSMYGRKYMGVARTTFVIDSHGKIAKVFEKVKPADHDQEVLNWIKDNLL